VSNFLSNRAGRSGGAIFAWKALKLQFGYQALVYNNSAGLDGGGFNLEAGAMLEVEDEGCPSSICDTQSRVNGICDLACMTRGCNWCLQLLRVSQACIPVTCLLLAGIMAIVRIVL
jgi:predicted outer membrane repeat protein